MKILHIILLYLLIFPFKGNAQTEFNFEFDYAQFRNDSTSNILEIYYSIQRPNIEVPPGENRNLIMHIQIENQSDSELIINKDWLLTNGKSLPENSLLGAIAFEVKTGEYLFNISVKSVSESLGWQKEYSEIIIIRPFFTGNFSISQIELASRIITENTNENSIFYKNTLEVFPNPSILFSNKSPVLFYYAELYDLNLSENDDIQLTQTIFNSNNQSVFEKKKKVNNKRSAIVDIGAINLRKHPTGSYTLVLSLKDPTTNQSTISAKKYFLVNPDVKQSENEFNRQAGYVSSEFGVLSEEECDDLFNKSKIIANSAEIDNYELMDSVNQKREFLYKFWRKRDDIPSTEYNEFKNQYFTRVALANNQFKSMSAPGYKTDRGRVYLRLGEPDEIERHPNETNTKPYEIWYYNSIEGGVLFIFGDITGFNYYQLLHSSMRGELQDPNWIRRIRSK